MTSWPARRRWHAWTLASVVAVSLVAAPVSAGQVTLELVESACVVNPAHPEVSRLLARFELPPALLGSSIDYAELRAAVGAASDREEFTVEAFPVTREWSPAAVSWDVGWETGADSWDGELGTFCDVVRSGPGTWTVRMDVTAIVQDWVLPGRQSDGLVLVPSSARQGALAHLAGQPVLCVFYSTRRLR